MQVTIPGFDPQLTADSGQCFRMQGLPNGGYQLVAGSRVLLLQSLEGDHYKANCSAEEWQGFWRRYLDLDRDYAAIRSLVPREDGFLSAAAAYCAGLRIFRQDPWETLISFIISQRKNVPAIKGCVASLSRSFGTPIGADLHAFPTPEQLAGQSLAALKGCGLGYRATYIQATAALVASGQVDLEALQTADDHRLMEALMALPGVGVKVASCVALFGYHRLHHFPRDVWILRVEQEHYQGRFPQEKYPLVAGVLQQYMFCYRRSPAYPHLHSAQQASTVSGFSGGQNS